MMRVLWLFIALLVVAGCGGGGGAVSLVNVTGVVFWLPTSAAPSPSATVQAGTRVTQTLGDGSFTLAVPRGTTNVTVAFQPTGGSAVSFRFDFAAVTADTDLGDLVIGPEKVRIQGTVKNAADLVAVPAASVSLGGRSGLTDANGRFDIADVAYDSASPDNFLALVGLAGKSGFFTRQFSPTTAPVGGIASIEDIFLQPDTGDAPPDTPYVILGNVLPAGTASGAIVELRTGGTLVRSFTVGTARTYGFWVPIGTYQLKATKPGTGLESVEETITLTSPTQVVRRDVTLE